MIRVLLLMIVLPPVACGDHTTKASAVKKIMVTEKKYGRLDGKDITEYTLTNESGMQVSMINYGAAVTKIIVPDKDGTSGDVVLGFDSLNGYLQENNPYFGCIVGRYANRIANAKFSLDNTTYNLAPNNNGQTLHGGNKGFDKVVWTAEKLEGSGVRFIHLSKDGEEGFPGNLMVHVTYTLTPDNELKIDYTAETDQPTPINLTNHSYFNLSGGKDATVYNHELLIVADKYLEFNDKQIPTGMRIDVENTPLDFTSFKPVGKDIEKVPGGYDHSWVVGQGGSKLQKVAFVYHPVTGRMLEVFSTEPGLQFYSGNHLDGRLKHTKDAQVYTKHGGLCLEAQHFPDSPNHPSFPNTILEPGNQYSQTTIYKFSVKR